MNEETQKRLISLLSAGIGWGIAHTLTERFLREPEARGIEDDLKEALLKAGASVAATLVASTLVRSF